MEVCEWNTTEYEIRRNFPEFGWGIALSGAQKSLITSRGDKRAGDWIENRSTKIHSSCGGENLSTNTFDSRGYLMLEKQQNVNWKVLLLMQVWVVDVSVGVGVCV